MPGNAGGEGGGFAGPALMGSAYSMRKDKLNLSGLLNVLDGVVDTPDRIVGTAYPLHTSSSATACLNVSILEAPRGAVYFYFCVYH